MVSVWYELKTGCVKIAFSLFTFPDISIFEIESVAFLPEWDSKIAKISVKSLFEVFSLIEIETKFDST